MKRLIKLPTRTTAILVIDMEACFADDGTLPVTGTYRIVEGINALTEAPVQVRVYSLDDHPEDHCSFMAQGGPFPPHGITGTADAEFINGLFVKPNAIIVRKGTMRDVDSMSPFATNAKPDGSRIEFALNAQLKALEIDTVIIVGVAGDYCVRAAALDAVARGYKTYVCSDLIKFVDPSKEAAVIAELIAHGVEIIDSDQLKFADNVE